MPDDALVIRNTTATLLLYSVLNRTRCACVIRLIYRIQSHFPFPAGNGFRAQHHSAHTEMIAHEQEMNALINKSQFMVAEPWIY